MVRSSVRVRRNHPELTHSFGVLAGIIAVVKGADVRG